MAPRNNAPKTRGKPFAPGNPGRPRGARHKTTLAVEALLQGEAEALTRKTIELAIAGDVTALKMCLGHIAPAPRDRMVLFEIPHLQGAADVPHALAAILAAVAAGELSPSEGVAVTAMLDRYRTAYEAAELEARLVALEERL